MHAGALASAHWADADGTEHVGVLGDGVHFVTIEDPATLGHDDLRGCYGKGYTSVPPAPPLEGPGNGLSPLAGHGTWTTGTVCGTGTASAGHYRGLAPQSKVLFYVGVGSDPGKRALQQGFLDDFDPPVVTASTVVPPHEAFLPLADGADVLVTWAAGNEGGDGAEAFASDAKGDPRVLVVAATQWDGTAVATYSSRGAGSDPTTWPHLSAVGCHIVAIPRTQPGSSTPYADALAGSTPQGCRPLDANERLAMLTGSYQQVTGTSFAAPSVAAAAVLMAQVNPAIATADLRTLLLNTTDVFLPTADKDGDGAVTRHDFWLEHGYAAGRGLLNVTAAVTAAHYMARHGATAEEGLACAAVGLEDGALRLNPGPRCIWPPTTEVPPASLNHTGPPEAGTGNASSASSTSQPSRGQSAGSPALPLLASALLVAWRRARHHR